MPISSQTNLVQPVKRVAVMGAGAVGSYFGGMLARAGVPVTMIARPAYVEAVRRNKLFLDAVSFQERVAVEASVDPSAVRDANVVLFCVKGQDNEEAARAIAPHLAPDTIVVSLQNGVDNVERIRAASGHRCAAGGRVRCGGHAGAGARETFRAGRSGDRRISGAKRHCEFATAAYGANRGALCVSKCALPNF